jgi:transcriptional regulator with XRE-family HTH domain
MPDTSKDSKLTPGERITGLRAVLGYSRVEFSKLTGIDYKLLENIELGYSRVNCDHYEAIAKHWPEYTLWLITGKTVSTPNLEQKFRIATQKLALKYPKNPHKLCG